MPSARTRISLSIVCFFAGSFSTFLTLSHFHHSRRAYEPSEPFEPFEHADQRSGLEVCTSPSDAIRAFSAANLEGSDKGTPGHSYELMYGPFLAPLLGRPVSVLEIGVENGRSLKLWQRLFPKHQHIVGIGYGEGEEVKQQFKRQISEKHVLYTGSQADINFLDRVKADLGTISFDLIVDDGSHVPWHQVFTLEHIFENWLKDGGLYIVEDIETPYWDATSAGIYGYPIQQAGAGKQGSFVEKMKSIADTLNRGVMLDPEFHVLSNRADHFVSHILFSQNVVMLWKKNAAAWERAEVQSTHIDSYPYNIPAFINQTRTEYKEWKQSVSWEIAGMQRG